MAGTGGSAGDVSLNQGPERSVAAGHVVPRVGPTAQKSLLSKWWLPPRTSASRCSARRPSSRWFGLFGAGSPPDVGWPRSSPRTWC